MDKIKGIDLLPTDAQIELKRTYLDPDQWTDPRTEVKVHPDPQVSGVYAVLLIRYDRNRKVVVELLWTNDQHKQFDEVEYTTWPPTVGHLKFF